MKKIAFFAVMLIAACKKEIPVEIRSLAEIQNRFSRSRDFPTFVRDVDYWTQNDWWTRADTIFVVFFVGLGAVLLISILQSNGTFKKIGDWHRDRRARHDYQAKVVP